MSGAQLRPCMRNDGSSAVFRERDIGGLSPRGGRLPVSNRSQRASSRGPRWRQGGSARRWGGRRRGSRGGRAGGGGRGAGGGGRPASRRRSGARSAGGSRE